jgi:putative MATE family efflux protein
MTSSPTASPLLTDPPFPLLVRMAGPSAMAFLVQAAVSMAETGFIARLGLVPLAAIALMLPALMLMQMLANGALGGAVSSSVARALGRGDREAADAFIWHALAIAVLAALAFAGLYAAFGQALLGATGAPPPVVAAAHAYGSILFLGVAPIWISALLTSVVRGTGDMQFPARLMIAGSLVQIPLSGALMLGAFGLPGLGLKGSAIAVILVATGSSLVLIWRLAKPGRAVRLALKACHLRLGYFADILRVGALASLSPVSTVLTIAILNTLIGRFGVETLAGYGVVARVEFLLVPLVFGIGAALTALVGVNMGAGQVARAERIGWMGGGAAAGLAGVVGLVLAVVPGLWTGLFTRDPTSLAAGALYLHIVGPVFAFQGLGLALYFASQGAGAILWPVIATLLRLAICVGGAVLVMRQPAPQLAAVYACIALGMAVYGAVTALALWRGAWRRKPG